jgi:hypothetical protein
MLQTILDVAFSGFWPFVGCWILLALILAFPVRIIRAIRGYPEPKLVKEAAEKAIDARLEELASQGRIVTVANKR